MNKSDKIIAIFYAFLIVSVSLTLIYFDYSLGRPQIPGLTPRAVNEIILVKTVNVPKQEIFDVMADIQKYPIILPKSVLSATITNQVNNTIYAEEEVMERGIKIKFLTKHTLFPYDKHILEIMSGDAQGTRITATFDEANSTATTITTKVELHLSGKLEFLGYMPKPSIGQKVDTAINSFADYTRGFDNKTKKIIDDLYREILLRPADIQGLEYYGSLLESGEITIEDIRKSLLESEERRSLLESDQMKNVDEFDNKTKKIIDDLYREILLRPADIQGLEYYGSLLESGEITIEDIRKSLLESEERKSGD